MEIDDLPANPSANVATSDDDYMSAISHHVLAYKHVAVIIKVSATRRKPNAKSRLYSFPDSPLNQATNSALVPPYLAYSADSIPNRTLCPGFTVVRSPFSLTLK